MENHLSFSSFFSSFPQKYTMSKDIKDISQSLEKAAITEDNLIDLSQDDEPSVTSSTVDNLEHHSKKLDIESKTMQTPQGRKLTCFIRFTYA